MLRAKSSQLSFYGEHIYDRVIPKDHFLKLLDKAVDFSFVNELCRDAYTPDFGRPAYEPDRLDEERFSCQYTNFSIAISAKEGYTIASKQQAWPCTGTIVHSIRAEPRESKMEVA